MKGDFFKEYGDKLLFALALAVLATGLVFVVLKTIINKPAKASPSIVFTHWWDNDIEKEALLGLKNEFESLHNGIIVILENRPYEELRQKLFSQNEEKPELDLVALDPLWVPELLKKGIIENQPNVIPRTSLLSHINVLYYNVETLREAGFVRPPKTRGEFLDYVRGHALSTDINNFRGIYDDIFPWIWAAGEELIKDGKPALTSRPAVENLSFLASLGREGLIVNAADNREKLELFVSGRAAFMIASAGNINFIRERMGDDAFGITSIPVPDNYAGKSFYAVSGWTVGISTASNHREEARLLAEFLAERAPFLSEKIGAIPGTGVFTNSSDIDPFHSKLWDIVIAGEPAHDFSGLPWTELEEIFKEELRNLFEEKSSPAETAEAIQKKWEVYLENVLFR